MSPRPDPDGMLANEWRRMHEQMIEKNIPIADIEICRLMFLFGARIAINAGLRSPVALIMMNRELRELAREAAQQLEMSPPTQPVH